MTFGPRIRDEIFFNPFERCVPVLVPETKKSEKLK